MGALWGILGYLWASTDNFPPYAPQIVFILDNPCVQKIGGRSQATRGKGLGTALILEDHVFA